MQQLCGSLEQDELKLSWLYFRTLIIMRKWKKNNTLHSSNFWVIFWQARGPLQAPVAAGRGAYFWRIVVCIADSDILHPLTLPQFWDHIPNCQCSTTPHKAVCIPINLHCWSNSSNTCCKTVEDRYCPVTVLPAIAIQCFALFTRFQIMRKIWKFCIKFGHLIFRKIHKFVATRCQILS